MDFKQRIKDGLAGKYTGLSNGLNRINDYIFGIQRNCYTLFGGLSGAAKTTLIDYMLINGIQDAKSKNIPINIFYYSLEIDEISKKANWLSFLIHRRHKVIVSPEKIKGLGDFKLSEEELKLVDDTLPELEDIWSNINWVWESSNPTGINKSVWRFMSKRGEFDKEDYFDEFGNKKQRIVKFIPHNSDEYNILVIDHLALLNIESQFNLKQNIDKMSEYAVRLRNLFGMTIMFVQQFNQGLSNIDRVKYRGVDISPEQNDFKDSSNPYTDSDIAIGIMNAYKMGLDSYLGYNISQYTIPNQGFLLRERFRSIKIIKNRLSRDNISLGLLFIGESGTFEEIPKPEDLIKDPDFLDKIYKITGKK